MERAVNSRKKSRYDHDRREGPGGGPPFSDEPNTQIVVKIKQALLGTYLAAKE